MKNTTPPSVLHLAKRLLVLVVIGIGVFAVLNTFKFLAKEGFVKVWRDGRSEDHTKNSNHGSNKLCPLDEGMEDHLRREFVLQHNDRRWRTPKYNGTALPWLGYMMALKYDCELEEGALHLAENMCSGSLWTRELPQTGFNMLLTDKAYGRLHALKKACRSWWREYHLNGGIKKDLIYTEKIPKGIRNFTQMIWANTTKLGCAVKQCSTFYSVACLYAPRGNRVGDAIYSTGGSCSKCPEDTQCVKNCTDNRETRCGLCYAV